MLTLPLPVDVVAAKNFSPEGPYRTCAVEDVADDEMILDVGPKTAQILADYVSKAKTIVWNGPVGVFEMAPYAQGTAELAKAIARGNLPTAPSRLRAAAIRFLPFPFSVWPTR